MDSNLSKKAAKRKRQRLKRRQENVTIELEEQNPAVQDQEEVANGLDMDKAPEKKSKEEILAERQAKKAAKQKKKVEPNPAVAKPEQQPSKPAGAAKLAQSPTKPAPKAYTAPKVTPAPAKVPVVQKTAPQPTPAPKPTSATPAPPDAAEKDKDKVHQEREARKLAKQAAKKKSGASTAEATKPEIEKLDENMKSLTLSAEKPKEAGEKEAKPTLSKAERRAIQEAQRAAKAKALEAKKAPAKPAPKKTPGDTPPAPVLAKPLLTVKSSATHKVKLFKHLYSDKCDLNINVNQNLHPAIVKLGIQFANDTIVGSNARCYGFLNAMKILIKDYMTPAEKVFSRGLEAEIQPAMEYLQNCRPFAVSMTNALKYIKLLISQENSSDSDDDKKRRLMDKIDTYGSEQIETAAVSISLKVREKINNGDVILTYGCSSLIKRTLVEAYRDAELKFRVIVVDSRPDHEGQEMLKALTMLGINCTYILINAISFMMPEVTKVLLGAHALLANGYVMSRVGTAQIALIANSCNVPVLVCCETHKFSERVQTDAFVFNELGDPNALVTNKNTREASEHLKDWENLPHLTPLNLRYDITPPELVTAVVNEVAILPCTSVQVILRVKPAE